MTLPAPRLSVALSLLLWLTAASGLAGAAEPLILTEIAPGVFVHQGPHEEATPENLGGFANVGCIVGEDAVAVIDSGGGAAHGRLLREAIARVTDKPLRYLILTHMHPDHSLGAAAFTDSGAVVVGHHKLPRALAARGAHYIAALEDLIGDAAAGTEAVEPSLLVEDRLSLDLGGRVLELTAWPTAHSDNDLTVFDPASSTLWAGDLLFMQRIPAVDGSLKGWLEVMEGLRQIPAARVVPGHGPATAAWPAALADQERYLTTLLSEIRAMIAAGGTMEQAVARVGQAERGRWQLFERYHARNIVTGFAELEWE
jgi:quinoprotein relay system zinc metallohydrolase 2